MSKKDYVALAAIVQQAVPAEVMKDDHRWCNGCNSAREYIARHIAEYAQEQRLEFNVIKFYKACGLPHLI